MSVDALKKLREQVSADRELNRQFQQAASLEQTIELAKGLGYEITPEDIRSYQGDLSDSELEQVAGGFTVKETFCQNNVGKTVQRECTSFITLDK